MRIDWTEYTKTNLKSESKNFNKECFVIGAIEVITNFDHYTNEAKLEAIKAVLNSYNEITNDLKNKLVPMPGTQKEKWF